MQMSKILEPTEIFLMTLARTSEIESLSTVGDFGSGLIFFDDTRGVESLFFLSIHINNYYIFLKTNIKKVSFVKIFKNEIMTIVIAHGYQILIE